MSLSQKERFQLKVILMELKQLEAKERESLRFYLGNLLNKEADRQELQKEFTHSSRFQLVLKEIEKFNHEQLLVTLTLLQKKEPLLKVKTLQATIEEARAKKNMVAKVEEEKKEQKVNENMADALVETFNFKKEDESSS